MNIRSAWIAALCGIALVAGSTEAASANTTVADNGFRPNPDGFSFENYGGGTGAEDLTAAEMQKLFGSHVCASGADGSCVLIPPAKAWMHAQNKSMDGGHCMGFAVLAQELYKGQFEPLAPGTPFSYELQGNHHLQRAIAYGFVYQVLESVISQRVTGTPNHILAKLKAELSDQGPETYTLGIYKPDGSGGHAVTPFAVVDRGGGMFAVRVYDNNYPGETRDVVFDTHADTWTYNAAINPTVAPERYTGTAKRPGIELDPTTPGLGVQPCPFCEVSDTSKKAARSTGLSQVQLIGNRHDHAHLLIRDRKGRRLGTNRHGRLVNTIPGGQIDPVLAAGPADFNEAMEPTYLLPDGPHQIAIDGRRMRRTDTEMVSSIGPGHDVAIRHLAIGPGERDLMRLRGQGRRISFRSAKGQHGSPALNIGTDDSDADYALKLKLSRFHPGATVHVRLDTSRHLITFFETGNPGASKFVLSTLRESSSGNQRLPSVTARLRGHQSTTYSYKRF